MLIKKDEEPFFYKFLSIAKEIIRKNKRYTPVFYGDDEKEVLIQGMEKLNRFFAKKISRLSDK